MAKLWFHKVPGAKPGNCYVNCWEFMLANRRTRQQWTMVQAVVKGTGRCAGKRIGHCWIETEFEDFAVVYDPGFNKFIPKSSYYKFADPQHVARYTLDEMYIMAMRRGYIGAWTKAIWDSSHTDNDVRPPVWD